MDIQEKLKLGTDVYREKNGIAPIEEKNYGNLPKVFCTCSLYM